MRIKIYNTSVSYFKNLFTTKKFHDFEDALKEVKTTIADQINDF